MRIIFFLLLSFLFSCNSSQEKESPIPDPSIENPWTYINRISDTLPETEFSLFNTRDENRATLKKYDIESMEFKYRIGQNRFLKVQARSIIQTGAIICYMGCSPFTIDINENDELLINGETIIQFSNIDTLSILYLNYIKYNKEFEDEAKCSVFSINCSPKTDQNKIRKVIEVLAEGYWKFLNPSKNSFMKLDLETQNLVLKNNPFEMIYQFYWRPIVPKIY